MQSVLLDAAGHRRSPATDQVACAENELRGIRDTPTAIIPIPACCHRPPTLQRVVTPGSHVSLSRVAAHVAVKEE